MSAIAAAILTGLGVGLTGYFSGKMQSDILKEGQEESRQVRLEDIRESRKARKSAEELTREQIAEGRRQFDLSYGMSQEAMARNSFRDQVSRFTGILDKNESLKNLFINRLAGLRG